MPIDRRTFLGASVAGAAMLGACGGSESLDAPPEPEPDDGATLTDFDPTTIPEDEARFPLGVSAGETTATSALLWTSVASQARLRVWRDADQPGQVKLVRDMPAVPVEGIVKVTLAGLGPGQYRYAFFDEDLSRRSALGRFRTAFAFGDRRPLTLGLSACTNYARAPYTALQLMAETPPDALCHLGDFGYHDGSVTRADYDARWQQNLQDPGYRAILASTALYPTWDDHEIGNDFDPERLQAEAPDQLAAAIDSYYAHLPIAERTPRRLWRSHRWGDTAEVFVLDCRSERRPSTRGSDDGIYVSPEQFDWLLEGVETSPCHFKIICSSVPITRLLGLWDLALNDRWQGYVQQRDRLIEHLTTRVSGRVLFFAGDFHCGYVGRVEPEGPGRQLWEIATSTGARSPNPIAILYDTGDLPPEESFPTEQFVFGTGNTRNVTTVTLDPRRDTARVRFVDGREDTRGNVLFDDIIPFDET